MRDDCKVFIYEDVLSFDLMLNEIWARFSITKTLGTSHCRNSEPVADAENPVQSLAGALETDPALVVL